MLVTALMNIGGADARVTADDSSLEKLKELSFLLNKVFNFYDPDSELSTLNRDRQIVPSNHLRIVITTALRYCTLSDGRYDISLGKLFAANKEGSSTPTVGCTWRDIKLSTEDIVLGHPDVMIDLGSIAKGYIIDRLSDATQGPCYIDAHGDGCSRDINRDIRAGGHSIEIQNTAFATSKDLPLYTHNGIHHITGMTDIVTSTVLAQNAMDADAMSTVLFVCGSHRAIDLLAKLPAIRALLITGDYREIVIGALPLNHQQ